MKPTWGQVLHKRINSTIPPELSLHRPKLIQEDSTCISPGQFRAKKHQLLTCWSIRKCALLCANKRFVSLPSGAGMEEKPVSEQALRINQCGMSEVLDLLLLAMIWLIAGHPYVGLTGLICVSLSSTTYQGTIHTGTQFCSLPLYPPPHCWAWKKIISHRWALWIEH